MTQPRSQFVDPTQAGTFQCVSRSVRRSWLCSLDKYFGKSFEHIPASNCAISSCARIQSAQISSKCCWGTGKVDRKSERNQSAHAVWDWFCADFEQDLERHWGIIVAAIVAGVVGFRFYFGQGNWVVK